MCHFLPPTNETTVQGGLRQCENLKLNEACMTYDTDCTGHKVYIRGSIFIIIICIENTHTSKINNYYLLICSYDTLVTILLLLLQ